jgi:hypothetical protein
MFNKRKAMKLLSCQLINKKFKLSKKINNNNDVKFRFEHEGSFLFEYYISLEDASLILRLNKGNILFAIQNEYMVYNMGDNILCIVSN